MKALRQVKYFFEWVWDWWIFPVVEGLIPKPKSEDRRLKDEGLTLDDD